MPRKKKTAAARKRVKKKSVKKKTAKVKPRRYTRDKDHSVYRVLADGDEVPGILRKKGINRLVDNTTPDQELKSVTGPYLMTFFWDEIKKRFLVPAKKKKKRRT